ncbi:hypothetical protein GCM10028808_34430 [Spirosoma migulaei]
MLRYKTYSFVALLFIYAGVAWLRNGFQLPVFLYSDETHFFKTTLQFAREPIPSARLLQTYSEVITPLAFIIGGWICRLFDPTIQTLRLYNVALSFLLLTTLLWLNPGPARRFWIVVAGLAISQYYYYCSVYFYTDMTAVAFVMVGLIAYLKRIHWLSGVCLALAISTRQYMVVFPLAILGFELVQAYKQSSHETRVGYLIRYLRFSRWYVAALLTLVGWILFWNGLGPSAEIARQEYDRTQYNLLYSPGFVMYAAACIGAYYVIPEFLIRPHLSFYSDYVKRQPALVLTWLLLICAIIVWFPARQTYNDYFKVAELGLLDRLVMSVGFNNVSKQIVFGGLMLLTVLRFARFKSGLAGWIAFMNILMLGKAYVAWDKYLLPTITALWFLTLFDKYWPLVQASIIQQNLKNEVYTTDLSSVEN